MPSIRIILVFIRIIPLTDSTGRLSKPGFYGYVENLDLGSHIGSCFVHKHRLI